MALVVVVWLWSISPLSHAHLIHSISNPRVSPSYYIQIHCPHARQEYLELLAARQRRQHHKQPQQGDSSHSLADGDVERPESSAEFMERYYDEDANPIWSEKKKLLLAAPAPGSHEWKATEGACVNVSVRCGWGWEG